MAVITVLMTALAGSAGAQAGPNLAIGRPATQSSTGFGAVAERATDGNTNGVFAQQSVTHTFSELQPWWEVDLGSLQPIDTINIWNRTDCCLTRLSDFHVFVSDVPFTSDTVAGTQAQPGVTDFAFTGVAGELEGFVANRLGRYVRVQLAGAGFLSMAEVEIIGQASMPTNLAQGKPAQQSTTGFHADAGRATDGNTSGVFSQQTVTHTVNQSQPWWEVDLGSVQFISGIDVFNRTDCCSNRLRDFHVLVSDVPFTGDTLAGSQNQAGVLDLPFVGIAGDSATVMANRTGRYVRVQLAGSGFLSLAEVRVMDTPGPDMTPPTTTIDSPEANAQVPTSSFTISGSSSDDLGVQSTGVSLRDAATGLYLTDAGSFTSTPTTLAATLSAPGSQATDWSLPVVLPPSVYNMSVSSLDESGNAETPVLHGFVVFDGQAPTVPSGVTQIDGSNSTITLSWDPSTDDTGVEGYRVYRDGEAIGVSNGTTYHDTTLTPDFSYGYEVTAFDSSGNESTPGATNGATTSVSTVWLSDLADPTWQVNGVLHAILPVGDTIYIGGDFTLLLDAGGDSVTRTNIAAIDRVTGTPTAFAPVMDDIVSTIAISPDHETLYVGGQFLSVDGVSRPQFAIFDTATHSLQPWSGPYPNGSVRALATNGETLFMGGTFTRIGTAIRTRVAAFDVATQTLDSTWRPSTDKAVKDFVIDSDRIWIAGNFGVVNDASATGLAAVDRVTGATIPTDHPAYPVLDLAAQGNQLFLAGAGPGGRTAAYDRTTGVEQWIGVADGNVQAVDVIGEWAYFGGHYTTLDTIEVGRLTRHNIVTGEVDTNWLPDINGVRSVNRLAVDESNVYIGGDFTAVSSEPQAGFAQFRHKTAFDVAPRMIDMVMFDHDQNGYVDTVEVLFDRDLANCNLPCLSGWTLSNAPSGATLANVVVTDDIATLNLNEGAGDPETGVNNFRIKLDRTGNIRDVDGRHSKFPFAAPLDAAAPHVVELRRTNVGTSGLAETGDTITVKWSEKIDTTSLPATTDVVITDLADGANDQLTIAGLIDGSMDLGSDDFIVCVTTPCGSVTEAVFSGSTIDFGAGGRTSTVALGTCSGSCELLVVAPTVTVTYVPATTIVDTAGSPVFGSITKTFDIF